MNKALERKSVLLLLASLGLFAAVVLGSAAWLPDRVALHFNIHGEPDAWGNRVWAVFLMLCAGIVISTIIPGVVYLARGFPDSLINLPNKRYWLAAERRGETFARLFRQTVYFTVMVLIFMAAIQFLLVLANHKYPPSMGIKSVGILTVLLLLTTVFWAVRLVRGFNNVSRET